MYQEYAGFWRRFAAVFIDGIILGIVVFPVMMIVSQSMVSGLDPYSMDEAEAAAQIAKMMGLQMIISLVMNVLYVIYFAAFESSKFQATPGKMALGIIVTDLEGKPISFMKGIGRNLGKILSALILYIGFIMAGFTERRQGLHDIMAGTLVVKK